MNTNDQKKKLRVGLLFGGQSGEHEVSIVSAASIAQALDKEKYEVVPIGITKEGAWITSVDGLKCLLEKKLPDTQKRAIIPGGGTMGLLAISDASGGQNLPSGGLDVVIPILHGPLGEDGTVQGLLELMDIPYVGSGVLGSAVGMDKIAMKQIFRASGFAVARDVTILEGEWRANAHTLLKKIEETLGSPVFVKPANMGSSVGISKCSTKKEIQQGTEEAFRFDRRVIVEEAIVGREIECAVLGNDSTEASVPGEVRSSNNFYDYNAKYVDGKSETIIPASVTDAERTSIQDISIKAFRALDCAGMARVDSFLCGDGSVVLNEVNTIPGFTNISMFPKLWEASGLPYPQLIERLINLAFERYEQRKRYRSATAGDQDWYTKESA